MSNTNTTTSFTHWLPNSAPWLPGHGDKFHQDHEEWYSDYQTFVCWSGCGCLIRFGEFCCEKHEEEHRLHRLGGE